MDEPAPRVRALSARLVPDCSIELEVSLPCWDEPQLSVIHQPADFRSRIGDKPRPVDLEELDATHLLAQPHVARHIRRFGRELERQRMHERHRRRQAAPCVSEYESFAC